MVLGPNADDVEVLEADGLQLVDVVGTLGVLQSLEQFLVRLAQLLLLLTDLALVASD